MCNVLKGGGMSYFNKSYESTVINGNDSLTVKKISGTDWAQLHMQTNNFNNGDINLRSKEAAESLHFMLGQLLNGENS